MCARQSGSEQSAASTLPPQAFTRSPFSSRHQTVSGNDATSGLSGLMP